MSEKIINHMLNLLKRHSPQEHHDFLDNIYSEIKKASVKVGGEKETTEVFLFITGIVNYLLISGQAAEQKLYEHIEKTSSVIVKIQSFLLQHLALKSGISEKEWRDLVSQATNLPEITEAEIAILESMFKLPSKPENGKEPSK